MEMPQAQPMAQQMPQQGQMPQGGMPQRQPRMAPSAQPMIRQGNDYGL
jgi:hypothetical protein